MASDLDGWIARTGQTGPSREVRAFADGLLKDEAAVRAALSLPWSNGQVEGQVNRKWLDDRTWDLNTFRLVLWDPAISGQVAKGETFALGCDVYLGPQNSSELNIGEATIQATYEGRILVLVGDEVMLQADLVTARSGEWLIGDSTSLVRVTEESSTKEVQPDSAPEAGAVVETGDPRYAKQVAADFLGAWHDTVERTSLILRLPSENVEIDIPANFQESGVQAAVSAISLVGRCGIELRS